MGKLQATLDADIYSRTASLFATKRDAFGPDTVESLASDVLQRLVSLKRREPSFDTLKVSDDSIAAFCDALIQTRPDAALQFISDRRVEGVTRQGVYLGYIVAAARSLGQG
ncbi:hypothetical protein OCH239_22315 [Roseivivax halodurans JCM 10272]|uniref:Uncharacterized protein n=1 Tax=Roseivivax halodurans JCM 10272 TaxID=1449350 RepID=X7E2E5_9RHOB|nr:hypothetical protein [Roseivivax halodurans]ETX10244.1 hypothetical protein OCH239_22315 [Roseivivax halodurans JCM 10272]